MEKTKIEWTDSTWNPVTGCYHKCPYCYARQIAERFGEYAQLDEINIKAIYGPDHRVCIEVANKTGNPYPEKFRPTLHRHKLTEYQKKKGRNIFVCSMADLFGAWVPDEWIESVFAECLAAPQHNYIFLTKNPARYIQLAKAGKLPQHNNFWYGSSVTGPHDEYSWFDEKYHWFLSVEPLLENLGEMSETSLKPEWIIIGAETGRRAGKVVPALEWIESIVNQCRKYKIPVFMKDSLADIWPHDLICEYPEGLRKGEEKDGK